MSSSAATTATTATSTPSYYSKLPEIVRRQLLGPALRLLPAAGWYKSVGHQLRWLHRLSFLEGSERYAASLSYFYFDREHRQSIFTEASRLELASADAEYALKAPFDALDGDLIDRMLYADSKVRLPDHPVMISDRMSMAHGLEVRSPFMDHRLAEFAAHLPWTLKVRGRNLRYIQRKLAARYLPPEILSRSKQGFSSALPYILRDEYRSSVRATICSNSDSVRAGILASAPHRAFIAGALERARRSRQPAVAPDQFRDLVSHDDSGPTRGELQEAGAEPPIATAA